MPRLARVDVAVQWTRGGPGRPRGRGSCDGRARRGSAEVRRGPPSRRDDSVVEVAARARPRRAAPRRLDEAERSRGRDPRRVLLRPDRDRQLLVADGRMRKVDLVGDGEPGSVRLERDAASVARNANRLRARERRHRRVEPLEARRVKEAHERESRAIQDGNLRPVELDHAVVQPLAEGGRQDVLDRAHRNPVPGERRRIVEGARRFDARRDHAVGAIEPAEHDPVAGGGRTE